MKPVDITPRAAPIGQHEVRMGTADGIATRIAELEAQSNYFELIANFEESDRLAAEARKLRGDA